MLHAFGRCDVLRVENRTSVDAHAQHCCTILAKRLQHRSCSIHKCCMENFTIFKFEPTTPNMSQQVATGLPKARNVLRPTMLLYAALKRRFGRLARAAPRKYVFWDAIQYFTGQRYTLTKLQNAGNFKLFSHRVVTTAKKAQNLERTL